MYISEQILRLYIEQKLSVQEAEQVKEKLMNSSTLMRRYLDLKEGLALQKEKTPINNILRARILKKVHEQKYPTFKYDLQFLGINLIIQPEAEGEFLSIASLDEEEAGDLQLFKFIKSHLNSSVMINLQYFKQDNYFIMALAATAETPNKMQVYQDKRLIQESPLKNRAVKVKKPLLPGDKLVVTVLFNDEVKFSLSFSYSG